MATRKPLTLPEEILLLALRDEKGTIASGVCDTFALGGAILAELLLRGRISVAEVKRKKMLADLRDSRPLGDPILDECLERVAGAKRRATLQTWVSRFARTRNLKHRVAQSLCNRGILRMEEDKILLLFLRKIYPEIDPKPERELVERMRRAIFTETKEVEPRTAVLVSLAHSANLLKVVFDKKDLKHRKARLKKIMEGEVVATATKQAIEAMQAAVLVVCVLPP